MIDDKTISPRDKTFRGQSAGGRIEDGILVFFPPRQEPTLPFQEGERITIAFGTGVIETLYCAPRHGSSYVDWMTPSGICITFAFRRVDLCVWKIYSDESQHGLVEDSELRGPPIEIAADDALARKSMATGTDPSVDG